jgi:hypothetical protein
MAKGFILIELLISMVISSIVMITFVTAFNQIQKTASSLENTISIDTKAALFQAILENDLSGAFTPSMQALNFSDEELGKEKIEKVFYEEKEKDEVSLLAFVSCNVLYPAMNFKPRIARIFYYFKDDYDNMGSKIFYRQQNKKELDYGFAKDDDSYRFEVIDGIKSLRLDYVFEKNADEADEQEEGQQEGSDKNKSKLKAEEKEKPDKVSTAKKVYKILRELDDDGESAGKIPSYIIATLQLWQDMKKGRWVEYTFKFRLYSSNYLLPSLSMPKPKNKNPNPQQPGQQPPGHPGAPGAPPVQPGQQAGAR